jgi:hypothetical protein
MSVNSHLFVVAACDVGLDRYEARAGTRVTHCLSPDTLGQMQLLINGIEHMDIPQTAYGRVSEMCRVPRALGTAQNGPAAIWHRIDTRLIGLGKY